MSDNSTEAPARVLRRAAELMRKRAEAAWDAPWHADADEGGAAVVYRPGPVADSATVLFEADWGTGADAIHIASWHPLVAADFAAALEAAADEMDADHRDGLMVTAAVLKAARTYLGEETPA